MPSELLPFIGLAVIFVVANGVGIFFTRYVAKVKAQDAAAEKKARPGGPRDRQSYTSTTY